jgi:hypothetical protein
MIIISKKTIDLKSIVKSIILIHENKLSQLKVEDRIVKWLDMIEIEIDIFDLRNGIMMIIKENFILEIN